MEVDRNRTGWRHSHGEGPEPRRDRAGRAPAAAPGRVGDFWSPEPVLGYRMWRVLAGGLAGARARWIRPAATAVCLSTGARSGVPHRRGECGSPACGIYALRDPDGIRRHRAVVGRPGVAVGLVALVGTVVEHDRGYRAERAVVLAAGSAWGDRLVAGWSRRWLDALFADPVGTLSGSGVAPDRALAPPAGGRMRSLAMLADVLEERAAAPARLGVEQQEV